METQLPELRLDWQTKRLVHNFPSVQQLSLKLPSKTIITNDSSILELGGAKQDHLNFPRPVKKFHVFHNYCHNRIEVFYLVVDDEDTLHIISRQCGLQVLATVENVSDVKIQDFTGAGYPQVHLLKIKSTTWEPYDVDKLTSTSKNKEASSSGKISAPLQNALESCDSRLKFLRTVLTKKRMLRAKVVSSLDPENQEREKTVQIDFCKYLILHGRCIQVLKVKSRERLEDLKIISLTPENVNIAQPGGAISLDRDSEKILVSLFGSFYSSPNFSTALEYSIDGIKFYIPLPPPCLKTVINTLQTLKVLGATACIDILPKASSGVLNIQWTVSGDGIWGSIKEILPLTLILASSDGSVELNSCDSPVLAGVYFLALPQKQLAIVCFRDTCQVEAIRCLLSQYPVIYRQQGSNQRVLEISGIAGDLRLILQKKHLANKTVPLGDFFKVLQDLIHELSAFAK